MRELTRRGAHRPAFDDVYDAFKHPRRERPSLDDPRRRRARARSTPPCATARSTCSTRIDLDARRPAARRRLRLRHGRAARAPARRDAARHAPAHGRLRASRRRRSPARPSRRRHAPSISRPTCSIAGGDVRDRHRRPTRGPTTTSGPRTRSTSRRSASTPRRSPTRAYARVRRRRRLRRPAPLDRRRLGVAHRSRAGRAAVLAPRRRRRVGRGAASAAPRPSRPTSRCSTCAGTRPTPSPAGRARACRPRPSGRSRRAGTSLAARQPLARRAAPVRARRPVGTHRRRRERVRACTSMLGDVWEWTASDFRAVPGLPVVPVPRVLRGVLRSRVQGAARRVVGDAPGGRAHHVPQLGLPDPPPDLRRLPLRARTRDDSMCRHLAYLGPPVAPRRPALRRAARAARQAERAAAPDVRATTNPDGWGVGWYAERRHDAAAGTARPRRSGTTHAFADASHVVRAARSSPRPGSRRPAPPSSTTGNAPFVDGPWLVLAQRHRRTASATASATSCARSVDPARLDAHRRRRRHRGAVRARPRAPRRRRHARPTRSRPSCSDVLALTTGRLNLLLTDGAARRTRTRVGNSLFAPRTGDRRPKPLDDDAGLDRGPRPLGRRAHRRRRHRCPDRRHSEGRPMTTDVTVDVHLEPDDRGARARADVRAGLARHAEDAAAEVVLRRPRQRAVRRDHPAARVLPDPHRARDPRRARRRHRRAAPAPTRSSSSARGTSEKTRLLLDALARRGHARALRALRRERGDAARRRRRDRRASTRASTSTRSSATSSTTSATLPDGGHARSSRSSAAPSATSRPSRARQFLADARRRRSRPATRSCSAPTW